MTVGPFDGEPGLETTVAWMVVVMCTAADASPLQSKPSLLMLAPFSQKRAHEGGVERF